MASDLYTKRDSGDTSRESVEAGDTSDAKLLDELERLAFNRHPFTCPNRGDGNHQEREGKDLGELEPTGDGGMACLDCDYTQYPPGHPKDTTSIHAHQRTE